MSKLLYVHIICAAFKNLSASCTDRFSLCMTYRLNCLEIITTECNYWHLTEISFKCWWLFLFSLIESNLTLNFFFSYTNGFLFQACIHSLSCPEWQWVKYIKILLCANVLKKSGRLLFFFFKNFHSISLFLFPHDYAFSKMQNKGILNRHPKKAFFLRCF